MSSCLVISNTEKSVAFFSEILKLASFESVTAVPTCAKARALIAEKNFDVVIINAPLKDESGETLARHISSKFLGQVIFIVKEEYFDDVSALVENDGVLTVAKPLNKLILWSAIKLAKASSIRMKKMLSENEKLRQQIRDIKIIDRAKCILISYLGMNEQESHKYIEKQAMDMRETKIKVAEGILKTYEY